MTLTDATRARRAAAATDEVSANPHRFRLSRAGVLNVWQYDDQVFEFADGRLLLRGANGAGKSKTLEMLLPFALDGDKLRITASARHHTSLVWLMTDGYEGQRTGYVWVEFARDTVEGGREVLTCGVGIRASSSAKTATSWYFTCPRQVGVDLLLEDDAGPLSRDRCRAAVAPDGQVFDQGRTYKQHVGRVLFGLEPAQYDELLRLLYWLRQPQVGEDIEPAKLAVQLAQALPPVDDDAIRAAGDTFDELAAFGEQIDRRQRAADAVVSLAGTYAAYALSVVRRRSATLVEAHRELGRRAAAVVRARSTSEEVAARALSFEQEQREIGDALVRARARLRELESSPEARSQQHLLDLETRAAELGSAAERSGRAARVAAERAGDAGRRVDGEARQLGADLAGYSSAGQDHVTEAVRAGVAVHVSLPAVLDSPPLRTGEDCPLVRDALDEHAASARSLRPALGELLAAVVVVDDARRDAEAALARRDAEERRSAEAERRAEQERGRRDDAAGAARVAEAAFATQVEMWRVDARSVPVELPELTASSLVGLGALAREAAAHELERLRTRQAEAAAARVEAERALGGLRLRRAEIESERDQAPAEPPLGRTPREDTDGAPLWRLVDFVDTVAAAERAGLEAALEGAGLLDAWVRADGSVLDGERLDAVLPLGPRLDGVRTLASLLRPDVPTGCPVATDVVDGVLARVAVAAETSSVEAADVPTATQDVGSGPARGLPQAAVGVDGSWRLGPLVGRTAKPAAQYVGSTARSAERARRLAEVDARLASAEQERVRAGEREEAAGERGAGLRAWVDSLPSHVGLLTAWTVLDERTVAADRAGDEATTTEEAAQRARAEAAERRRALDELAAAHGLPTSADGLSARRDELRGLDARIARHADGAGPLRARLGRWSEDWSRWRVDEGLAGELRADAAAAQESANGVGAQLEALRETVGADVEELSRRLAVTRSEIGEGSRRDRSLQDLLGDLREELGDARRAVADAQERLREQEPVLVDRAGSVSALGAAPGLVPSALGRPADEKESAAFQLAGGVAAGGVAGVRLPPSVVELARRLAALPEPRTSADAAALFAAWQEAASSDAADHEPRVVTVAGDLMVALGRDDGGEHAVGALAERLVAAVTHDRELLTERERTLFEEHLIGDLGEMLRRRRNEAEDLVHGMNRLLAGVTTSQGIAVRLQWQLRDDVPEDARRAVTLLGRTVGSLLATERAELRDALHRLIEASRAEAPEDSYTEHLGRALDYRRWFAFRISYTRPELQGRWQDLHRRSPLSQGEQKVVCYLPLFAAAAAHFTSLAGAAPHAPRFVLLDDAFPKIDVRTHPLLFGLLVSFDLDFVVTSERLWGDHASVPSLAIYEALRDPAERGIAQYRYVWDGALLQAVGA